MANVNFFLNNSPIHDAQGNVITDGMNVNVGPMAASKRGVSPGQYKDPRPLNSDVLLKSAVAGYNTGDLNVLISLAVGLNGDYTTTPGPSHRPDYGRRRGC
jgi:hypothetical protein